jgi:hypothetical protein
MLVSMPAEEIDELELDELQSDGIKFGHSKQLVDVTYPVFVLVISRRFGFVSLLDIFLPDDTSNVTHVKGCEGQN